jgi:hypothetical protein
MDETIVEIPREREVFVIRITGDGWDRFVGQRIADVRTGPIAGQRRGKFIEFRFESGTVATIYISGDVREVPGAQTTTEGE